MTLNPLLDIKDLEKQKFVDDDSGNVTVRTVDDTLKSLIETLQELTARLTVLSACKGINDTLRVSTINAVSTAVTGPQTSAQFIAAFLTSKQALENQIAILSNIQNVAVN